MPPVDRNNPVRGESSDSRYSLMEFMRDFPDDASCLEWLWRERHAPDGHTAECPKCERQRRFHKVKSRPSWSCDHCGHHLHPTAGTIFNKSSTSLQLWFYAIYLMTSTRCGISAKQLERELGVTYKTAWRMFNKIRNELMADDEEPLSGHVEVDEASVDGKPRNKARNRAEAAKLRERSRATVLAAVERGGRVKATVLPSRAWPPAQGEGHRVASGRSRSSITDYWMAYKRPRPALRSPQQDQSLGGRLRRWRHPHEHGRGVLRQPQDRHPGQLQEGLPQVAPGLPQRVHVALQPPQLASRDVRDVAA